MKIVSLPPVRVARGDLDGALHAVFGPATLRRLHGPSLRGEGDLRFDASGRRSFSFDVSVDSVPPPIRRFFCGSELRVTTRQRVESRVDERVVSNRMKLHFVGAELFTLRPRFWLRRAADGEVTLGGAVRHDAVLPPPLNGIAEGFMALNTRRELLRFEALLREEGVVADAAPAPGPSAPAPGRP